jgi:LPS sulfotransferase NodH
VGDRQVSFVQVLNPAISYIIASVQRSGTHLLCSILRNTGVAGSPEEYFLSRPGETWEERWNASSRHAYVEGILKQNTGVNGVFGTVVMWSYFDRMCEMLRDIPDYKRLNGAQLLAAVFCQPKYVWMRRRNHVEQAVSWAMACQTGVWTQQAEKKSQPQATPKFDFKVIDEWCNRIEAHDSGWENYFHQNKIEPLVLFYEDVVASHRTAAERVLKFLGLPFTPDLDMPTPAVEKQATRISEQWVARYLKLKHPKKGRLARVIRRVRI